MGPSTNNWLQETLSYYQIENAPPNLELIFRQVASRLSHSLRKPASLRSSVQLALGCLVLATLYIIVYLALPTRLRMLGCCSSGFLRGHRERSLLQGS